MNKSIKECQKCDKCTHCMYSNCECHQEKECEHKNSKHIDEGNDIFYHICRDCKETCGCNCWCKEKFCENRATVLDINNKWKCKKHSTPAPNEEKIELKGGMLSPKTLENKFRQEVSDTQEESLREIVYRNWKNGDEVGLYTEVSNLLQKAKKEVLKDKIQQIEKLRKWIPKEGEPVAVTKEMITNPHYNSALEDCIKILNEETK